LRPYRRGLDGHHQPFGIEGIGEAFAHADQLFGLIVQRDGHQESIAGQPRLRKSLSILGSGAQWNRKPG
jgi:hypothetical protein